MDFVMKQALGGATKDVGKMLGGDQAEKDPEAQKKEEDRREALRQQEEERKLKHAKMEAERERVRQNVRDKYGLKRREEREAEAKAAMEAACSGGGGGGGGGGGVSGGVAGSEGSLTRPKRAIPPGDEQKAQRGSKLGGGGIHQAKGSGSAYVKKYS
ncbi:complexin-1-like isoform X1 [Petromyzon marinus]|uniref:Complexin-2-like isoform X1 n=1 Tax=Petromyzon marinus TaxID=7757 RepID=A0AAJ7T9V0_PETMA|nr:complexin-2-like isoform X1 [Petromyzon marinus]XP_032813990.1 complexin-2-like isoform X1 [Petromyzon marinus]XP_032813991.1 complexin-2-like isoform X1 [Petromyzon marinus]